MWEGLILFINLKQDSICLENFLLYYHLLKVILITHFLQIFLYTVYSLPLDSWFFFRTLDSLQFHQTMAIVPILWFSLNICIYWFVWFFFFFQRRLVLFLSHWFPGIFKVPYIKSTIGLVLPVLVIEYNKIIMQYFIRRINYILCIMYFMLTTVLLII